MDINGVKMDDEIKLKFRDLSIQDGYLYCVGSVVQEDDTSTDSFVNMHLRNIKITDKLRNVIKYLKSVQSEFQNFKILYEDSDIFTSDGQSVSRLLVMYNYAEWNSTTEDWTKVGPARSILVTWRIGPTRAPPQILDKILKEYSKNQDRLVKCAIPQGNQAVLVETIVGLERARISAKINKLKIRVFKVDQNKSLVVEADRIFEISQKFDAKILSIPIRKLKTKEHIFDLDLENILASGDLDDLSIIRDRLVREEEVINGGQFEGVVTQILDDQGHIAVMPKRYLKIKVKTASRSPRIIYAFRQILSKIYQNSPDGTIDLKYHDLETGSILMAQFQTYVARVHVTEILGDTVKVIDIDSGKMVRISNRKLRFLPELLGTAVFPAFVILVKTSFEVSKGTLKRSIDEICSVTAHGPWCQRKLSKSLNIRVLEAQIPPKPELFEPESPPNSPPKIVKNFRNEIIYEDVSSNLHDDFDINFNAIRELSTAYDFPEHAEIDEVLLWGENLKKDHSALSWDIVSLNPHLDTFDGIDENREEWNEIKERINEAGIRTELTEERKSLSELYPVVQITHVEEQNKLCCFWNRQNRRTGVRTQEDFRQEMHDRIRKERLVRIEASELETEHLGIIMVDQFYSRVVFTKPTYRTFDKDELQYSGVLLDHGRSVDVKLKSVYSMPWSVRRVACPILRVEFVEHAKAVLDTFRPPLRKESPFVRNSPFEPVPITTYEQLLKISLFCTNQNGDLQNRRLELTLSSNSTPDCLKCCSLRRWSPPPPPTLPSSSTAV